MGKYLTALNNITLFLIFSPSLAHKTVYTMTYTRHSDPIEKDIKIIFFHEVWLAFEVKHLSSLHYGAQKTESSKLRYTGSSAAFRMNMNRASKEKKKPLD